MSSMPGQRRINYTTDCGSIINCFQLILPNWQLLVAVDHNQLRTMASEIDPIDWPLPRTLIGRTPWATTTPHRLNRKFTLQPAIYVHMYIWRICGTGRGWMIVFIFFVFYHAWKLYTNTTHTKIKFYISYIIFFLSWILKTFSG